MKNKKDNVFMYVKTMYLCVG